MTRGTRNDGRYPDGASVAVPYPPRDIDPEVPWELWPLMTGVIEAQTGPDEWSVIVTDPRAAVLRNGKTPPPPGTPPGLVWHPACFRGPGQIRRIHHGESQPEPGGCRVVNVRRWGPRFAIRPEP